MSAFTQSEGALGSNRNELGLFDREMFEPYQMGEIVEEVIVFQAGRNADIGAGAICPVVRNCAPYSHAIHTQSVRFRCF